MDIEKYNDDEFQTKNKKSNIIQNQINSKAKNEKLKLNCRKL